MANESSDAEPERIALERAHGYDLSRVEALLEENGLPSGDVRSAPPRFYVAYDGDDPVGVGGLEIYGAEGLLRSVVVEPSLRNRGYGTELCTALETEARACGVETLYLLTTAAREFFAKRGYGEIDRSEAPASIRRTAEFEDLCPATATCMRKSL